MPPEAAQLLPDDFGHGAADTGVDFVEHHRRDRIRAGVVGAQRGDLDREADA